jgi:tetratricopeptide (TPR) repeat protein
MVPTTGRATRQWTVAGVVMALAALLLLSVTFWPPSGGDTRLGRSLALREFDYSLEGNLVWKSFLDEPPPLPPADAARLRQVQQELENRPRDVRLNLELGFWSLRAGDAAAAQRAFEQAQRIEPGNTDAALGIATARFQAGAYADAYERFRQLAASHPTTGRS